MSVCPSVEAATAPATTLASARSPCLLHEGATAGRGGGLLWQAIRSFYCEIRAIEKVLSDQRFNCTDACSSLVRCNGMAVTVIREPLHQSGYAMFNEQILGGRVIRTRCVRSQDFSFITFRSSSSREIRSTLGATIRTKARAKPSAQRPGCVRFEMQSQRGASQGLIVDPTHDGSCVLVMCATLSHGCASKSTTS